MKDRFGNRLPDDYDDRTENEKRFVSKQYGIGLRHEVVVRSTTGVEKTFFFKKYRAMKAFINKVRTKKNFASYRIVPHRNFNFLGGDSRFARGAKVLKQAREKWKVRFVYKNGYDQVNYFYSRQAAERAAAIWSARSKGYVSSVKITPL